MQICDALPSHLDHRWKNVRQTVHTRAKNTATRHSSSPGVSRLLIEQSVRKIAQNTQRTIRKKSIPESKEKVLKPCGFRTFVAAGEGFEPSHTESESAVLPLHKPAIFVRSCRTNRYYYTGKQEFVKGFLKKIIFADFSHFQGVFYGKYVLRVYHQKRISSFHKWDPAQSLLFL